MHRVSSSLTRGHGAGAALLTFIVSLPLRTFPTQRHASNAPPVMGSWRVEWWLDGGRTSGAHCGGGGAGGSFSAGVAQASLRVASRTERLWISARRLVCSPPSSHLTFVPVQHNGRSLQARSKFTSQSQRRDRQRGERGLAPTSRELSSLERNGGRMRGNAGARVCT